MQEYSGRFGEFPKTLSELVPVIVSNTQSQGTNELIAMLDGWCYFPPNRDDSGKPPRRRIVLVEKLGHYRFSDGGYVVGEDFVPVWKSAREYKEFSP